MRHANRTANETERVRRVYDEFARRYDQSIRFFERLLFGAGRRWVCSRAHGDVLEIGIGTGRNLPYYPQDVRLTGIELSPAMLAIARQRAAELGLVADLRVGDAQALPFPAERFDTVVFTLALCTIPDDRRAVAEAWRVLRPRGQLLLLEHVRSPFWPIRFIEWILNPLTVRLEGDHLLRDPLDYLEAEGFVVEQAERRKCGIVERVRARKEDMNR